MKLLLFAGLLVGAVWVWGRTMPREHRASSTITLVAPPDSVWRLVRDIAGQAAWWNDVRSVRRLTGLKRESYEQDMKGAGPVRMEVTSTIDGQRLITTILNDEQQDWGGSWTVDVRRTAAGTEVTVTEEGWVEPALFRVVMKLRGGAHRTIDGYLRSLGAHFGETVSPRRDATG
jgi:uncharacterized protein YndB with AHSA1/START domain